MKPGRVMIYLTIFIVFAFFYYFFEIRSDREKQRLIEAEQQVFALNFDEVNEVEYLNKGIYFHFQKDDPYWRMVKPIYTPADDWVLEGLIREALGIKKERVFPGEIQDEAQYGLDNPEIVLTLIKNGSNVAANSGESSSDRPGDEASLVVGKVNPTGRFFYARLKNNPDLFTINSALGPALSKNLYDLRDKSLLLYPGENIDSLVLSAPGRETVELSKKSLRNWEVASPEKTAADNDVVQKFIFQGLKGRVTEFVPPETEKSSDAPGRKWLPDHWPRDDGGAPKDKYGFSRPAIHLKISSEGWPVSEISIGKMKESSDPAKKMFWAKSTERKDVMLIDQSLVDKLDLTLFDLKDRHMLHIDREEIASFEIISGRTDLKARYADDEWIIDSPAGSKTRQAEIIGFLMDMKDLRYIRVLESEPEKRFSS